MQEITIILDGFRERISAAMTLPELILKNRAQHKDLVVEVNGSFVHPSRYQEVVLHEGDRVELIHPAFGG